MPTNKKANRLIHEKSPYLLQHAYNPVDWFPWGEEAFEKAKREDKPIFLSIGYSTCHWCHVMEKESFEDMEVAELINERFIAIKVDREERPDIDSVYMTVCQLMNGHGGWPLNLFLTPDKVPFYAGTYFPKKSRPRMPGIKEIITKLYTIYKKDKKQIQDVTKQVQTALQQTIQLNTDETVSEIAVENGFRSFLSTFDETFGGFGTAPKFPTPHQHMFLLRYYYYTKDERALNMVVKTLDGLERGGIYDHIGFGFARYSTDEEFLVPHFEKMLYDNALLTIAYTECYQVTKSEDAKKVAKDTIRYVLRDLTSPEGGFYSAEDADSEGEEGKYYVWSYEEILTLLGDQLGTLYCAAYGITEDGNFEGKNIPNLIEVSLPQLAEQNGMNIEELLARLEKARTILFEHRKKRIPPHKDDKIITSWNGLMIAALAKASRVFQEKEYLTKAIKAIDFIESNLFLSGRLMIRYRDGEVKELGVIDDYAYLLWAYIELYEATFDVNYLLKAQRVTNQMIELFWDDEKGGFFFYGKDAEDLLIRQKEVYDSALPSGNSVAALQMLKLARFTGNAHLEDRVNKIFSAFSYSIQNYPMGHTYMLMAFLTTLMKRKEIVILGEISDDQLLFVDELLQEFYPEITYLVNKKTDELASIAPFINNYKRGEDKAWIYICENYSCHKPVKDIQEARNMLHE